MMTWWHCIELSNHYVWASLNSTLARWNTGKENFLAQEPREVPDIYDSWSYRHPLPEINERVESSVLLEIFFSLAMMQILRVQTLLKYADEESASKTSYRKWEVTETEIKTCKSRLQCLRKLDMQLSGNTWDQTYKLLTPSCSRLAM